MAGFDKLAAGSLAVAATKTELDARNSADRSAVRNAVQRPPRDDIIVVVIARINYRQRVPFLRFNWMEKPPPFCVFYLGFYKEIQNPKHMCVCTCVFGWTSREIDARTDDDDDDDAVVVALRAHNAHQGPRREIITLSKKKRILRALSRVVSFLFFNYSRERGNWWNR